MEPIKEQQDNTQIVHKPVEQIIQPQISEVHYQQPKQAQLWDADKVKYYDNIQNFYNYNYWGYGVQGQQTQHDPRTEQGQIISDFNYAKENVHNFTEAAISTAAAELLAWATASKQIGQGAESIVTSSPISTTVTKTSSIPLAEAHAKNLVPGSLRLNFKDSINGLNTYTQSKVLVLKPDQVQKIYPKIREMFKRQNWKEIIHPNLEGLAFQKHGKVVSDILPGNIGRDFLGRIKLIDFNYEPVAQFMTAIYKRGGTL